MNDRGIFELLGTGTSTGVPTMACGCPVCRSGAIRDRRLRVSGLLRGPDSTILIDTSPDLRTQYFRAGQPRVDAILYTHHHFDHIGGFDDVRGLNFRAGRPIDVYGMEETIEEIRRFYAYAFSDGTTNSSAPRVRTHVIDPDRPFEAAGIEFTPVPLHHGPAMTVLGYRTGTIAYCTDCSDIPEPSRQILSGVTNLILDGLRTTSHPMHMTIAEATAMAEQLGAGTTWLTHLAHDRSHREGTEMTPEHVRIAFDGLKIPVHVTPARRNEPEAI